ncbi:hypothetical protein GCM10023191_041490 [Actinoallomurus oryzae]|jgi:hypothetical protein|uniref:Uncharacterized protein n=1 Tax=Actinoallomurus oryzae TaxID=502180 RepID=A0ABP8Q4U6_9ACTN
MYVGAAWRTQERPDKDSEPDRVRVGEHRESPKGMMQVAAYRMDRA